MIPRQPMKGETPLSAAEIPYLTYGNQTPSNPVSAMFQRDEHTWAEQCFRPVVPSLRSASNPAHPEVFKHLKSGKIRALQGRDTGFGLLWFGRGDCAKTGEVGNVGLEGVK